MKNSKIYKKRLLYKKEEFLTGFTLIEVLLVVAIVSISFLGIIRGLLGIGEGLINSRHRTIATTLAQEKIEAMKERSYARLFVSTVTVGFDNEYFPPETYTEGNKEFTRSVLVSKVSEFGTDLVVLVSTAVDAGLKRIKVQVEWEDASGTAKFFTLYNLRHNPDRVALSGTIAGVVRIAEGYDDEFDAIVGATVLIVENPNWRATTNEDGEFEIKTSTGDWTVKASQVGYFSLQKNTTVEQGETSDAGNFDLTPLEVTIIKGLVVSTSGVLVEGCVITCNDETSGSVVSKSTSDYDAPPHNFELTSVSTGTWTVYATTSSPVFGDVSGSTEGITRTTASQIPAICRVILTTTTQIGSISGTVEIDDETETDPGGIIWVSVGATEVLCPQGGNFTLSPVDAGLVTVTVNPLGFLNTGYTSETATATAVAGQEVSVGVITIYAAGAVSGIVYAAGGVDPFPGIVISAVDDDGAGEERGSDLSKADGTFKIQQLPILPPFSVDEKKYEIAPVLDEEEESDPDYLNSDDGIIITPGGEVKYSTFTITPAWGYIEGSVTDNGEPITTGVIIIASVDEIPYPPTESDITISAGEDGKYGGISYSEGIYKIEVRTDEIYNVYAWYTEVNASGAGTTTTRIKSSTDADLTGSITVYIDFNWP